MRATYRLQLNRDFPFEAAAKLVPYLHRLGISHIYLSPITEARRGSTHGYDVVDHNRFREALGGREGFEALRETVLIHGMELIVDFVPNHAGVGPRNAAWQDVLAYGQHSEMAHMFDVDWKPLKAELRGKILLPFLGATYGEALDGGEITVGYDAGRFFARYYQNRFALAPSTYAVLLERLLPALERQDEYFDVKELFDEYAALAPEERDKGAALSARLAKVLPDLPIDVDEELADLDTAELHELLERQHWRLAYWKTAGHEINYRRFFDINELVALRMEHEDTFWRAHSLLGELAREEGVRGVRIDHVDGLFDPQAYLDNLKTLGVKSVWVEKILAAGEALPDGWWTEGTSGYEFLNDAMGVLLDVDGAELLLRHYRRNVDDTGVEEDVYLSKRLVMDSSLAGELFRLASELNRLSEMDYHTRDFTLEALREALAEVIASFGRYRTYLPYDPDDAAEAIEEAVGLAKRRSVAQETTVYDFLQRVLTGHLADAQEPGRQAFIGRFQQYTAPVAAKGVEDTTFYRYVPLIALNEVGGEPGHLGVSSQAFHSRAKFRSYRYPRNLLATATHDHKRGEDTRARLLALAEEWELWGETANELEREWDHLKSHLAALPFGESLEARDRYLCYQMMAALWTSAPKSELKERLSAYMQKAMREAKLRTSWLNPNERYESLFTMFFDAMLNSERVDSLLKPIVERLATRGFAKSLAQLVLKVTTPGVPDFYQGTELLDLSLVDPDNRRPVDYGERAAMLDELEALLAHPEQSALQDMFERQDPRLKMFVTASLLRLRRQYDALFEGSYRPLEAADGLIAFEREADDCRLRVVVARSHEVAGGEVEPAEGDWLEVLTGASVSIGNAPLEGLGLNFAVFFQAPSASRREEERRDRA